MNLPLLLAASAVTAFGQSDVTRLTVHADRPGVKISPTFYGLMTEEINHAYDGGLYGELIQNRSFRDNPTGTPHWSIFSKGAGAGTIKLDTDPALTPPLGVSLRFDITSADKGNPVGVANDGYWGIPVRPNTTYRGSFYAKSSPDFTGPITVSLESTDKARTRALTGGETVTEEKHTSISTHPSPDHMDETWRKFTFSIRTGSIDPASDYSLVILVQHPGTIWLRDVSLFPPTFNNRPNGNRIDLMKMLGEMKPSFLRLPGGNYLEGNTIPDRFDWKSTIGDIPSRPGHQGPWGYRSSDGLGLLEFLEWCEDLHMQPVLAVYAGYSLRQQHVNPGTTLAPYVQDAIDEIEYVTGSTDTKWGAVRAKNGHPRPFPLTYIEVGNEDNFDRSRTYDGRFAQFYDAIKAKWPKLQLIATMPVQSRKPDVLDDHYYRSAAEMARDSGHYDHYERTGPKIFVGEWASIGGNPTPTFREALGDAAWLTGLERNSDLVVMESYAPLMVNVNPRGAQWPTNLIGYDGLTSFGSPSYYVQSMFAKFTGDTVLPVTVRLPNRPAPPRPTPRGAIGLGTYSTDAEYKDVEVTAEGQALYKKDFSQGSADWTMGAGTWQVEDGSLRQSSSRRDTHASAGDPSWTDYTYRVKAKKLSGAEGFMVLFHVRSATDYWQWNIGGWGDSRSAIQRHEDGEVDEVGRSTNTTVQTDRWYDVRIELHGTDIKCYLDDKLITEVTDTPRAPASPLYAAASCLGSRGEGFLKVVNMSSDPVTTDVDFPGLKSISRSCEGWILAGQPDDVNTVKQPLKVAPKPITIRVTGSAFRYEFPPHSIMVLRIQGRK